MIPPAGPRRTEPTRQRTTSLQLHGIPLGDDGLAFLLESRFAKYLNALNLSKTGITTSGAQRLLASNALPELIYLDVSGNEIECAFGDSSSSALISYAAEKDFKYVVMPMRI